MNGRIFNILLFLFFSNVVWGQFFVEYQSDAGIDHYSEHGGFLGGGAAFFDYDNDGDEDLYITGGEGRDHFYENMGDGTFDNKTIEAGLVATQLFYTTGVVVGDIDNDGFKDIFVTTWYSDFSLVDRNLMYKNNGDGTFTEIWTQSAPGDKAQTMGATFVDFDLDGLLDLYVINYVEDADFTYGPNGTITGFSHDCYRNFFYHNKGDGIFEEKGSSLGFSDKGCSLATVATDFDSDGDMDIYLANDFGEYIQPNKLYVNNIAGNPFFEFGADYDLDAQIYGMGIASGDMDNDLDLDLYVTNFGQNILLRNDGDSYEEVGQVAGVDDTWIHEDSTLAIGWGTGFLDYDNDGDLDLYVANGYVPSPSFLPSSLYMNDKLFTNEGDLNFEDKSIELGIENEYTARGMSYADFDNDGDLDIISVVLNVPSTFGDWQTVLYKNEKGNEKNWFQVTLEGVTVNRDAYGSKLYLYAGDKALMHEISGGGSHASHFSSRAHFGLDSESHIDSLKIIWTGGEREQMLYDLEVNQHIYIVEDTASVEPPVSVFEKEQLKFELYPNPNNGDKIKVNFGVALKYEGVLSIYNHLGQKERQLKLGKGHGEFLIDIQGLPAGVYLFNFSSGGNSFSKTVVVN